MGNRVSSDGKELERLVELIYETTKDNPLAEVLRDVKLPKKPRGKAQFDVLIKIKIAGQELYVAIECKDYGKKVSVKEIRDFKVRCDLVDGIGRKVLVAVNGFQSGVIEEARHYGIDLYHLNDVSPSLLESWIVIDSLRFAHYEEKRYKAITFFSPDGTQIMLPIDQIDTKSIVYKSGRFFGYISGIVNDVVTEIYKKEGKSIKESVDHEINEATFADYDKEITVPINVWTDFEANMMAIALNGYLFGVRKIRITIEYVYSVHTPSNIATRLYQQDEKEATAEAVSGVTNKLSFDLIRDRVSGKMKMFAIMSDGKAVHFSPDN